MEKDRAMPTPPAASYHERLSIPLEHIEHYLRQPDLGLFQALIAVLLAHGRPMRLPELATTLLAQGFVSNVGDMEHSLRKAWHGNRPVYQDDAGWFGLDLHTPEMEHFLLNLKWAIRPPSIGVTLEQPDETMPLTRAELEAALHRGYASSLSPLRKTAAVLDVLDGPQNLQDVEEYLAGLTSCRLPITRESLLRARSDLVDMDASGRLSLRKDHQDLPKVRATVRRLARPFLLEKAREKRFAGQREQYELEHQRKQRELEQEWAAWHRGIVHVVPSPEAPAAAVLLDVNARTLKTFLWERVAELPQSLSNFDWLGGLAIRQTLVRLGSDPERFRLAEFSPAQKTRVLNRSGRKLVITPELVIAGTTGISRPLGDPNKIAQYLAERQETKLTRRLESTAKALYAFYQQCVLLGCAYLRWGFLNEVLPLGWDTRGDPRLRQILDRARAAGALVEIVTGSVPGWEDPWARARLVELLDLDAWTAWFREEGTELQIPYEEIRAVRLAGAGASGEVGVSSDRRTGLRDAL
jgi:hypothetical protein